MTTLGEESDPHVRDFYGNDEILQRSSATTPTMTNDFVCQHVDEDKEAHVNEDGDGEKDHPTIHSILLNSIHETSNLV